jgi:hypothetical protein
MFGQAFNSGFFKAPCFTDTTDIFKDNSGIALYTLDYDASSGKDITTNTLQILGDTSCIATYRLNGGSEDLSGNYNGTETNITYNTGQYEEAAVYNGSSSKIVIPASTSIAQQNNYTFSAWFKTDTLGVMQTIYAFNSPSTYQSGIFIHSNGTNNIRIFSAGSNYYSSDNIYTNNQWYHIAVTKSSTNGIVAYLNGVEIINEPTATANNLQPSAGDNRIGAYKTGSESLWFDGSIDQVRIFNKAISASEVTTLYNEIGERDGTPSNVDFGVGGKSNYGARFNGSSSYIDVSNFPNSRFKDSTNGYTISFWFKKESGTSSSLQAFFGTAIQTVALNVYFRQSDNLFQIENGSGSAIDITGGFTYDDDNWHHFVLTDTKVYIDGSEIITYTGNYPSTFTDGQTFHIGSRHSASRLYYGGSIDQFRIFNKAISSAEVSKLYGNGAGEIACKYKATTTDVNYPVANTAYYKLDNDATDEVGSYDGTETNIEYTFGRFGQAAVFNGSNSEIELGGGNMGLTFGSSASYSLSLWFKYTTSISTWTRMFNTCGAGGNQANQIAVSIYQSKISIYRRTGTSTSVTHQFSSVLESYKWYNAVFTVDGTTVKLYLNGVEDTLTASTSTVISSVSNITLGSHGYSPYFNGQIDQVRIFSSVLNSDQVTKLYNEKPEADTSNFKTVLYEGNGGTQYISNVGFEPDMVWTKSRSDSDHHVLLDSIRGGTNPLVSSGTAAEIPDTDYIQSFDANGFTIKFDSQRLDFSHNENGDPLVAWCWKGGGDAVSNTDGSITSQVSANTEAGFSIVKYTGNNSSNTTVGHGLSSTPEMLIVKNTADDINWFVWNKDLGGGNKLLKLNNTDGVATRANQFDSTVPTSTVFSVGSHNGTNGSGDTMIAYCWHSVAGYSKIGNYTGNGSSTGPIVYTTDDGTSGGSNGFEPKFIMIKRTDTGYGWYIMDSARGMSGATGKFLFADTSASEGTLGAGGLQTNSTGFQITDAGAGFNANLGTYIYMAFK